MQWPSSRNLQTSRQGEGGFGTARLPDASLRAYDLLKRSGLSSAAYAAASSGA
jgi:hypothetical protein